LYITGGGQFQQKSSDPASAGRAGNVRSSAARAYRAQKAQEYFLGSFPFARPPNASQRPKGENPSFSRGKPGVEKIRSGT
jgi:hypothetical protein